MVILGKNFQKKSHLFQKKVTFQKLHFSSFFKEACIGPRHGSAQTPKTTWSDLSVKICSKLFSVEPKKFFTPNQNFDHFGLTNFFISGFLHLHPHFGDILALQALPKNKD